MSRFKFTCPCCGKQLMYDTITGKAVHMDAEMQAKEEKERELRYRSINTRMQAQMKAMIEGERDLASGNDMPGMFGPDMMDPFGRN